MTVYTLKAEDGETNLYLTERNLYGSSRLGVEQVNEVVASTSSGSITINTAQQRVVGDKRYELSNHLGNVLATISDRKLPEYNVTESLAYYKPDVVSYSDYSPFGVTWRDGGETGRYGFQGQEKDDEIKGEGNSVNYKFRMHDPRVGRFFAIDPLFRKFPYWSVYAFSGNQVIHTVELEGLENENNLNENEKEHEVQIHQLTGAYVKQGKEGDWIAGASGMSGALVVFSTHTQASNFAEVVNGEVKYEKGEVYPVVEICSNSFVAHEVFVLLEEQHGVKEDHLNKSEKRELLTVKFDKDRSDLFNYSVENVTLSNVVAIPVTVTTSIPIILYPDDMVSAGDVYIPAARLTQNLVDEFAASRAKRKQKERAAKKTSSSDSKYKQEAEHTKNTRQSNQSKHEKGQTRKITDKGGEKGDKRRTRYK